MATFPTQTTPTTQVNTQISAQNRRNFGLDMHRPAIVVGTVDSLVSKALNRGYGIARATYPIDFALVTNGAHWIIDEIQLCPESTTTLRQLAAFAKAFGTAEPFGVTCMSATVSPDLLRTVDNPALDEGDVLHIEPAERVGELAVRLSAQRTVRRLRAAAGSYKAVADAVQERHRRGGLTLVVVNTVDSARAIFQALRGTDAQCTLLHSRFRGVEREKLIGRVTADPGESGHIVVSTQVVEAGVDINASVLVTEAAPWPSIVQRAGRCNRDGRIANAEMWWFPPAKHLPYEEADVEASARELAALEDVAVTGEDLLGRQVHTTVPTVSIIRRIDLLTLFDTAPDLSGSDLDIAPFVRDADDLDVQLAWADWKPADAMGAPPADTKPPDAAWRCRVPLREVRSLRRRGPIWRFQQADGTWSVISDALPPRPGEILLMAAKDGGYDPEIGLDPSITRPVPNCSSLGDDPDPVAGAEDAYSQDDGSVNQPTWLLLEQHSDDVRCQAKTLLDALQPDLEKIEQEAVVRAAYAHDAGKSHDIWQDALCQLAPEAERDQRRARGPWAKSAVKGRLRYAGKRSFRHELVSMLLLDGPLTGLLEGVENRDLVRYLVLAHHGKLRVQVRDPDDADEKTLLGLTTGDDISVRALLGQQPGKLEVDLEQFTLGGDRSWTRTALQLRDTYGPFVLAYMETLVRIADWRASAGMKGVTQ